MSGLEQPLQSESFLSSADSQTYQYYHVTKAACRRTSFLASLLSISISILEGRETTYKLCPLLGLSTVQARETRSCL